jgi:hypothetical protein
MQVLYTQHHNSQRDGANDLTLIPGIVVRIPNGLVGSFDAVAFYYAYHILRVYVEVW